MYRREKLIEIEATEAEEHAKNMQKIWAKKKTKILEWNDKKTEVEECF